jgi:aspartate 1-decarboxylase
MLHVKVFKSKIHRAKITGANLRYEGSVSIPKDLMEAANFLRNEACYIWNINNGERLMTYIIPAERGSKEICLNGAAARLCQPGDLAIITTFADMTPEEAEIFKPTVVIVDENNNITKILNESGNDENDL